VQCDTDIIGRLNMDRLHPGCSGAHDILDSVIEEDECGSRETGESGYFAEGTGVRLPKAKF
jgi:hypothetical protein